MNGNGIYPCIYFGEVRYCFNVQCNVKFRWRYRCGDDLQLQNRIPVIAPLVSHRETALFLAIS